MRVLFLTHRLPYAPNRGDRIRAFHTLRFLSAHHDVHVVSLLHDQAERARVADLKTIAASARGVMVARRRNHLTAVGALTGSRALTHVLLAAPDFRRAISESVNEAPPDVVFSYCTGVAPAVFERPLDRVPCVLDMVDVDSEKWAELGATRSGPMKWVFRREASTLRAFERRAIARAAATTVVSDRERRLAESVLGAHAVVTVPNGVDVDTWAPPVEQTRRPDVVFCGVFNYEPNERGAMWLANEVWPSVKRAVPEARLKLVGMNPTARVKALATPDSVEVTGSVPDVRPYVWQASVAAAPMFLARGTQNKVLEALAAGLPCVVTPPVLDGLPTAAHAGCTRAGDATEFAQALISLLQTGLSNEERASIRRAVAALRWDVQLEPFLDILERAGKQAVP